MNNVYNYLMNNITPGEQSFMYQKVDNTISVFVNCKPATNSGQYVIVTTNMIFEYTIFLNIDKLYYMCKCRNRCSCNAVPPIFIGNYEIYDRFCIKSTLTNSEYYKLASLARFDHECPRDKLAQKYNVLMWVCVIEGGINFVEDVYSDGIAIYDLETGINIINSFADSDIKVKFLATDVKLSNNMLTLINITRNVNIKKIKIIINL